MKCDQCGTPYGVDGCPHKPPADAPNPGSGFKRPLGGAGAASAPSVTPPRGTEAAPSGIYVGAQVVPSGDFKLAALGFPGSGKTTFQGMLYFLLASGRFPGWRFAWSDSLRDLEAIREQLHRAPSAGGPTFPPRTGTQPKVPFMHLGLRRWEDGRFVDLYFPELAGEDVARIWTDGRFPPQLGFLRDFNGFFLFLDATATTMKDVGRYGALVTGLIELKGGLRLEEPVAVLLSKWDLVADQPDAGTPEEFFRDRFGGLHEAWRGQLTNFRVFAVSSVGKVRTLIGHDGLPIKRDGAVMHVPSPERHARGPDEDPVFAYKPLNLSRPVLWLLDELLAKRKVTLTGTTP